MNKKIRQSWMRAVFIYFFCAMIIACGYGFAPQGEYIDKRIQKIYVGQFDNKTAQAELENYVRTAFIDQFVQSHRFKVVESVELADATIKGGILNLTLAPLSYRGNTIAAEERATITMELTFREKESGKDIWQSRGIVGTVDYTVDNNINLLPATRRTAFIKLANDTAEKTFNQMMSGF